MTLILLLFGIAGLILGAELAIRGSLEFARWLRITPVLIGMTIFAVGTDLPEIFVVSQAALEKIGGTDTSGLILGEVVGTVLSQGLLILGIVGLLGTIALNKRLLFRDGVMMALSTLLVLVMALDGAISVTDGIVLMLVYAAYIAILVREERKQETLPSLTPVSRYWSAVSVIGGIALLLFSSHLTVESALQLAARWGVSQELVGLLIIGLGTSLPELATASSSVRMKKGMIAYSNLVGSNIFDTLFILGMGAVIGSGLAVPRAVLVFDLPFLFVSLLLAVFLLGTRMVLSRREAVGLIALFIAYFVGRAIFGVA